MLIDLYIFEDEDFYRNEILNDNIHFHIERLVKDKITIVETYQYIKKEKDNTY